MIAVDTNVLVRVFTNDDAAQARDALRVLSAGPVWIPKTVVLETEWVLRAGYGLARPVIRAAFAKLLAVTSIELEDRDVVERALVWYGADLDLADALHLASSARASSFASFDRSLARRAERSGAKPPVRVP